MLIDIYERFGLDVIGQVNLDKRIHRNRNIESLGKMSFEIIHTFMSRLEKHRDMNVTDDIQEQFLRLKLEPGKLENHPEDVQIGERPPMAQVPEYKKLWQKNRSSWSATGKHFPIASA